MKLTYDPKYNVAYISFSEAPTQCETLHISDDLKIDVAADGTIHGIELLNANAQLVDGSISIENQVTGQTVAAKIPA